MTVDADEAMARLRAICLALPETSERLTWGHPTFRVGEKIFASCGEDGDRFTIGFKCDRMGQQVLVQSDPHFSVAAYVGQHGWVTMAVDQTTDWDQTAALILESYRMIAPRRMVKQLDSA